MPESIPALVQSNTLNSGSSTTSTVSLTSNATIGNQLIIFSVCGGGQISTLTGGGTWTPITVSSGLDMWWCPKAIGGSTTATITYSATPYSNGVALWISEWSGITYVDSVGVPVNSTGSVPSTSPTITPQVGDLVLMAINFYGASGAPTGSPSSPWIDIAGASNYLTPGNSPLAYQIASSTSALTANWSSVNSNDYNSLGVAFGPKLPLRLPPPPFMVGP